MNPIRPGNPASRATVASPGLRVYHPPQRWMPALFLNQPPPPYPMRRRGTGARSFGPFGIALRLFFAGQIVSLCGTFLTQVAMVWLVYSKTGSGKMLGITAFAGQIPSFLLGPFAGVWVDRLNRRKLIVATQALAMCQSFALAALVFFASRNEIVVPGLIFLAFAQGLINSFDMPGRQAFLIEMVESREDLANAIALNSTMVHAARLVGPALAGFLIDFVGAPLCFLLDGVSYIAVIAALLAMRLRPTPLKPQRRGVLAELREGLRYVWDFAPIRAMLLLMALLSLTGMPALSTLMPIFANALRGNHSGPQTLGFLMGAAAAGGWSGAIYLASRKTVLGLGRLIPIVAGIFGATLIVVSFSHHLWLTPGNRTDCGLHDADHIRLGKYIASNADGR